MAAPKVIEKIEHTRGDVGAFKIALAKLCDEYGFDISPEIRASLSGHLASLEAVLAIKARR